MAGLRVLMVEDSPTDAKIVTKHLAAGFDPLHISRVDAALPLEAALAEPGWDVVVSDYAMPGFDALAALEIVRRVDVAIPFIVVSGTIGEEKAVDLIRAGAQDVVLKDRLSRLVTVIEREVGLRDERRVHARATRDLHAAEDQLRQAQKLDAIGGLAGGIAHDFNNLLSIILSYSELLMDDLPSDEAAHADLAEIHAAGKRAAELTRQLLAFSRKQVLSPQVLDLNAVVAGIEKMLRRLIGEDIELAFTFAPDLGMARLDPGQMEQVVMNLVINARDAMPDGGRVSVETSNVAIDEAVAAASGCAPGLHVMLTVSDTGMGMDDATRGRIFEPFFTTKPAGQGTGLGLSTVFGIVKQSGGSISVSSEPGAGTTFRIHFPSTDDSVKATPSQWAPPSTLHGTETILLVEDDAAVRQLAIALVTRLGYRVLETTDVDDAIARSDAHAGKIDLLLTDVVMPRMSGPDLARALVKRRPDLRVLYMSGYANRGVARHGVLEPGAVFVQKPLTPDLLARKLREAFAAPPMGPSSRG